LPVAGVVAILLAEVVLVGYYKHQFLSPQVLQSRLLLAVGVPVVQVVRQGRLEPTVFLALYLLQVVEQVALVQTLLARQAVLAAVQTSLAVPVEQLVKAFLDRVMLVGFLGRVQTIPAEAEVALERLV
jgi:hypothetical protein